MMMKIHKICHSSSTELLTSINRNTRDSNKHIKRLIFTIQTKDTTCASGTRRKNKIISYFTSKGNFLNVPLTNPFKNI